MKAVVRRRAGSADGLVVTDVPKPTPGPGEVLVKVHATSVTRGDVVLRRMPKLVARLVGEKPKTILGHEFAGEIEAVGGTVGEFNIGDRVFGTTSSLTQGAHAEYVTVPADGVLAMIPGGISYEQAAPVPVGAMAAWHFLGEGDVGSGSRILINGASGSVGSYAVQIAAHLGAHVTGVCSTSNVDLVAELGANEVIDYTTRDFTRGEVVYDVVFDAAGKSSAKESSRVLVDNGRFVTTQTRRAEETEDLISVRDLLASGSIKAVVDRSFTLDQIAEAHRHVESGHKAGNVVVVVAGGPL